MASEGLREFVRRAVFENFLVLALAIGGARDRAITAGAAVDAWSNSDALIVRWPVAGAATSVIARFTGF